MAAPAIPDSTRTPSPWTLVVLAALFAVVVATTWGRWGNVLVDAGGSLYQAAAVAQGGVLYRDLASPYGPVGTYALAAMFRLFGIHLLTAYATGPALVLAESCLLWTIMRRVLSEAETAVALAGFWVLQAFQPGPFDWVLPNVSASPCAALAATATVALLVARRAPARAAPRRGERLRGARGSRQGRARRGRLRDARRLLPRPPARPHAGGDRARPRDGDAAGAPPRRGGRGGLPPLPALAAARLRQRLPGALLRAARHLQGQGHRAPSRGLRRRGAELPRRAAAPRRGGGGGTSLDARQHATPMGGSRARRRRRRAAVRRRHARQRRSLHRALAVAVRMDAARVGRARPRRRRGSASHARDAADRRRAQHGALGPLGLLGRVVALLRDVRPAARRAGRARRRREARRGRCAVRRRRRHGHLGGARCARRLAVVRAADVLARVSARRHPHASRAGRGDRLRHRYAAREHPGGRLGRRHAGRADRQLLRRDAAAHARRRDRSATADDVARYLVEVESRAPRFVVVSKRRYGELGGGSFLQYHPEIARYLARSYAPMHTVDGFSILERRASAASEAR